jgi:hypothetical protein
VDARNAQIWTASVVIGIAEVRADRHRVLVPLDVVPCFVFRLGSIIDSLEVSRAEGSAARGRALLVLLVRPEE